MKLLALFLCVAACLPCWGQTGASSEQLQKARQLIAGGKPELAIPIYEQLLAAAPDNPTLLVNLTVAQFEAGHFEDVIEHAKAALRVHPNLVPARLFLGAAYQNTGRPALAVEAFEQVLESRPDERNALLMLAEALLALERYDGAARRFVQASVLLPEDPRAWYGIERACDGVLRDNLQTLEADAPGSSFTAALAGDFAFRIGRYGMAVRRYKDALAADPTMHETYRAMAAVYEASGHEPWAKEVNARRASLPPLDCESEPLACDFRAGRHREIVGAAESDSGESLYWRARACAELANEAFARLSQIPESSQWHEIKARRLEAQGNDREAAEHWRKALQLSPGDTNLRKGLALALARANDFEEAHGLLEGLLQAEPDSAELNFLTGNTLLAGEQPSQAIPYLKRAVELDPKLLRARAALGHALLQLDSFQEAIPHLKAATSIDEDGRVFYQLARAYQATGAEELAKESIELYREARQTAQTRRQNLDGQSKILAP